MLKQLKKWLKVRVLVINIIVVLVAVSQAFALSQEQQAAKGSGTSAGSNVLNKIGNKSGMNQRIFNPMTGGRGMSTFDDSKQFNAQLTCPSSKRFIEIIIQPGDGGDITNAIIAQDTDMDGNLDYSYTVPRIISGVCANGFISCDSGKWLNCEYYKWTADSAGRITVIEAEGGLSDLQSCYCINNSCGNNLVWSNLNTVLSDLGGGVVGALHTVNPQTAVSNVEVYDTSITYYGQQTGSCAASSGGTGTGSPQVYYNKPYDISDATQTTVSEQSSNPNSMYNLLYNASQTNANLRECRITRIGQAVQEETSINGSGNGSICTEHFVYITSVVTTDNNSDKFVRLLMLDTWRYPHQNCGRDTTYPLYAVGNVQWHVIKKVDIPDTMNVKYVLFCVKAWGSGCKHYTSDQATNVCLQFPGQQGLIIECGGDDDQRPSFIYNYSIQGVREYYHEDVQDNCQQLENDQNCQLRDEEIDGVKTIENLVSTGLQPQPSCRTFTGSNESFNICRDWWEKKRTYLCTTNTTTYDFSDARTRMAKITSTVKDQGESIYYEDLRKDNSGWVSSSNTVPLYPRDTYSDCIIKGCKVKKNVKNTQVSQGGTASQYQASTSTVEYYYRECKPNADTWVCPLEAGESLVSDCQCINDSGFNQAAVGIQMLRLAGQDMICSSGVPK